MLWTRPKIKIKIKSLGCKKFLDSIFKFNPKNQSYNFSI